MIKRGRKSVISAVIDPLLIEGGHTVSEIADLVLVSLEGVPSRDGTERTKSQIVNNVRQRMFVLPRYGYELTKDSSKRLKFVKETEARVISTSETLVRKSNKEITR